MSDTALASSSTIVPAALVASEAMAVKCGPSPLPLWQKKIEVIGVTGLVGSGKTSFILSIDPWEPHRTKIWDLEKSSSTYADDVPFERVAVQDELKKNPTYAQGYRNMDVFLWWLNDVRNTPHGKYRVLAIDPISEIESGLVEFVERNPNQFGYSSAQFARAEGLKWGAVKDFWKKILTDLAGRCETFAFTAHMKNEWEGGKPTGRKQAKGKETLMEISSLFIEMVRPRGQSIPSAVVLKERLRSVRKNSDGTIWTDEFGDQQLVRCMPERLPKATPGAIRRYINIPPDWSNLSEDEKARKEELTEEQKIRLELAREEAKRDTQIVTLEVLDKQAKMLEKQMGLTAIPEGPEPAIAPSSKPVSKDQLLLLKNQWEQLQLLGDEQFMMEEMLRVAMHQNAANLNDQQALAILASVKERIAQKSRPQPVVDEAVSVSEGAIATVDQVHVNDTNGDTMAAPSVEVATGLNTQ